MSATSVNVVKKFDQTSAICQIQGVEVLEKKFPKLPYKEFKKGVSCSFDDLNEDNTTDFIIFDKTGGAIVLLMDTKAQLLESHDLRGCCAPAVYEGENKKHKSKLYEEQKTANCPSYKQNGVIFLGEGSRSDIYL